MEPPGSWSLLLQIRLSTLTNTLCSQSPQRAGPQFSLGLPLSLSISLKQWTIRTASSKAFVCLSGLATSRFACLPTCYQSAGLSASLPSLLPWVYPCLFPSAHLFRSLGAVPSHPFQLTAIVVQGGKLSRLVATASAVAGPHAEFIPRGLSKFCQKHLCGAVGPDALPGPGPLGPVLQDNGRDRAAPIVPALQVKPSVCGVDVGEEVLVFAEGGFWGTGRRKRG